MLTRCDCASRNQSGQRPKRDKYRREVGASKARRAHRGPVMTAKPENKSCQSKPDAQNHNDARPIRPQDHCGGWPDCGGNHKLLGCVLNNRPVDLTRLRKRPCELPLAETAMAYAPDHGCQHKAWTKKRRHDCRDQSKYRDRHVKSRHNKQGNRPHEPRDHANQDGLPLCHHVGFFLFSNTPGETSKPMASAAGAAPPVRPSLRGSNAGYLGPHRECLFQVQRWLSHLPL